MKNNNNLILKNIKYFSKVLNSVSKSVKYFIIIESLIKAAVTLILMYFPKIVIDFLIIENITKNDIYNLINTILFFTILQLILNIINIYINKYIKNISDKGNSVIDSMFNDKIASIEYYHLEDPKFLDELNYAIKGMHNYTEGLFTVVEFIRSMLFHIFLFIGALTTFLIYKQYILLIFVIIEIILCSILNLKKSKLDFNFNKDVTRTVSIKNYYTYDIYSFRTQKNIRMYDKNGLLESLTKKAVDKSNNEYQKYYNKRANLDILDILVDIIIGTIFIIIVLGYNVYNGNALITISVVSLLLTIVHKMSSQFIAMIYDITRFKLSCDYQNYFINIMEMDSSLEKGTIILDKINSLEFKNVSFKYPRSEQFILKDVSFKINNKEKVSLIGVNGAGKTTLIKLIFRFYEVISGEILINDININDYDYNSLLKELSVVFQDFIIPSFDVKSNVEIIEDNKDKLYLCLKKALILDRIKELPNKEYTYINKWFDRSGVEFSGGELQRIAFARTLYKESSFVILDEPTSALDPVGESEIYYHFKDIVGDKLSLYISHRLSSCKFSDRIIVLDGASIVQNGNHKELIKDCDGLYYKMFAEQAKYYKFD